MAEKHHHHHHHLSHHKHLEHLGKAGAAAAGAYVLVTFFSDIFGFFFFFLVLLIPWTFCFNFCEFVFVCMSEDEYYYCVFCLESTENDVISAKEKKYKDWTKPLTSLRH